MRAWEVAIRTNGPTLAGDLTVPEDATAVVVFAHGSGSGRLSPRNREVASELQRRGLATLLMDLLSEEEERRDHVTGEHRFDIPLLAGRLVDAIDQLRELLGEAAALPIGLFGASTGAAAALIAAARRPQVVRAVVSRGGRPDLAGDALAEVRAPTLLIVGGHDLTVLGLNRQAMSAMRSEVELVIVPGASHLFEEAGALEEVARLAGDWFISKATTPAN